MREWRGCHIWRLFCQDYGHYSIDGATSVDYLGKGAKKKVFFCEPAVHLEGGGLAEGPSGSLSYFGLCPNTGICFFNEPPLCSKRPNYTYSHIQGVFFYWYPLKS